MTSFNNPIKTENETGSSKSLKINTQHINISFICLAAILLLINLPLLFNYVVPQHDTLEFYKKFYFIYNELYFFADIPDWLPFGFYGVQSDFLLLSFSPSMYFSMLFGLIFRIENSLLLFNLSLLLEQFILLFGSYLLARRLFKNRATIFIVCLTIICSTTLFYQIALDFHPYVYLPLIILFLLRFFDNFSPVDLIAAMLVFVVAFFGLPIYYAPVSLMIILIIFLTLLAANTKNLRAIFKRPKKEYLYAALLLTLLILILILYNYYILNAMNFTESLSHGRDPITKKTYLDVFLNFPERYSGLNKFTALIFPTSRHLISGLALHVGLITLAFALYAVIVVRRTIIYAFGFVTIILVLFSLGDMTPIAKSLYYNFPMMKYFRHIGLVVTNLKLFLPLMAGFGIDRLLEMEKLKREEAGGGSRADLFAGLIKISISILVILSGYVYFRSLPSYDSNLYLTISVSLVVMIYLLSAYRKKKVSLKLLLISYFIFQGLGYQALLINNFSIVAAINKPLKNSSKYVNRYNFQAERSATPPTEHAKEGLSFVHRKLYPLVNKPSVVYTFDYNFLQWDPCVSDFRTDFINTNVADLIKARSGGKILLMDGERLILPIDPENSSFYKTIGCLYPKIRLIKNVIFIENAEQVPLEITNKPSHEDYLLISDSDKSARKSWREALALDRGKAEGKIDVTRFSANELRLEATVGNESGLWLYYADAWHPGWKAIVNGEQVTIEKADIAFKAIKIEKGKNIVRFYFDNEPGRTVIRVLILFEILSVMALLAAVYPVIKKKM